MDSPIRIIHEDSQLVVIHKRPGLPSQPDQSGDPSALDLAGQELGTPLHPVHRLDRPAGGLLLAAPSPKAAGQLTKLLQEGAIERRYWALVEGVVEGAGGRLEHRLLHDRRGNRARVDEKGKHAALTWTARARGERYTLLEIELETGRHHQIRAQLTAAIAPIRGDLKYGARRSLPGGGIALHAVGIALPHPATGDRSRFTADPPADGLWTALSAGLSPLFR